MATDVKALVDDIQAILEALDYRSLERKIARTKPMSEEEIRDAFMELRTLPKSSGNAAKIRNRIVESHLKLVVGLIQRYSNIMQGDMGTLFSEGVNALTDAVERYDPNRGVKFITFATHWIKGRLKDFIKRYVRRRKHETPSKREIDTDENIVSKIDRYIAHKENPETGMMNAVMVKELLKRLPRKEAEIIRMHWLEGKTFKEIGDKLGMTYARAEQIEKKALYDQYSKAARAQGKRPLNFTAWKKFVKKAT